MTQPLDGEQENAYLLLQQMLSDWGLDTLAPEVLRLLQEGYTQNQIPILLQDTDTYKQRFSANEVRRQKGLQVLSPAEYLQTERSYRQVMANAGLPEGFYDQPSDFAGWIGNDVSPVEIQRRVGEAVDVSTRIDATTQAAFMDYYGLGQAELTAFILDAGRGRDVINRVVHGGRIAGAARGYGVDLTREQAERYGSMAGEDYVGQAQQFGRLAGVGQKLSGLYSGEDYGAEEAASEVFGGSTDAERKRKALVSRERGEFASRGGPNREGLDTSPGGF